MRISLAYTASFGVAVLLMGAATFFAMHLAFTRQLDGTLRDEALTLASQYRIDGSREFGEAIAGREAVHSPTRLLYAVFGPDGRRIAGQLDAERPALGLHDIAFVDPSEGPDEARGFALDLEAGHRLLVAADREWIERIDRTIIEVFGAGVLGLTFLGLAGAVLFGAYLRRRLTALSRGAEAIIAGDFSGRMPTSLPHDEFDELAENLNRMLAQIEQLVESLRQVSSDVAHDLRTPLTRLRQRLEAALLAGKGTATEPLVSDAIDRLDDVLALFAAILTIAEVESGRGLVLAPIDFSNLVLEMSETYEPAVRDDGRSLEWNVAPRVWVMGERNLLAQAVSNLLDNALRHTPHGTAIRVSLRQQDGAARLQVCDDGPGVPEHDRARIVRRFERLDRSRNIPGFGLGLNFVAAVARRLDGKLVFEDANPGLVAVLQIPFVRPAAYHVQPDT
jgi:signal transduction histidine kinase